MYDINEINKYLTNENVIILLDSLEVDYKIENDWITTNCIWHMGSNYKLKWRGNCWYCFSKCNQAYSMYDFVSKWLDVSFIESVKYIINTIGLGNEDISKSQERIEANHRLEKLKQLTHNKSKTIYKKVDQTILNDIEDYHHPYILSKGFKHETLTKFNVGFARTGEFKNMIVYPIDAPNGDIVSIAGRAVDDNAINKHHVLYESDKSITLYNISRINKNDNYIIVVESFKSCMSLYEWGYESVVAVMGASISDEQIKLLLKLGRKVICLGDNDVAGKRLNQSIYNRLYKYLDVVMVDLGSYTKYEKYSPCDLEFEDMVELDERLRSEIDGV